MELLHHFQCQFDDFFDLGTRILFDDRLDRLVDVGLAESKHGKCTGGFLDGFIAGGLEEHAAIARSPLTLDDLVLEFEDQALCAFESDALYAFDPVDILAQDGFPQFFRREG